MGAYSGISIVNALTSSMFIVADENRQRTCVDLCLPFKDIWEK